MNPSVFEAHWWLNFKSQALKEKWLKRKVTCHFKESNDDCYNLAALLRMYGQVSPEKVLEYARTIMPKLDYDIHNEREVALFVYLYSDDSGYNHLLDADDLEFIDDHEEDAWNKSEVVNKLKSNNEVTVVNTINELINWSANESTAEVFLEPMILLAEDKSRADSSATAEVYLNKMGYLGHLNKQTIEYDQKNSIHIISHIIDAADSLAKKRVSKVWKFHVSHFKANRMSSTDPEYSEMFSLVKQLSHSNAADVSKKITYIKTSSAFKNSNPAMKFQLGEMLMYKHRKEGVKILNELYIQARPVMKSALVVKYPDLFKVYEGFWQKMKSGSTEIEKMLV